MSETKELWVNVYDDFVTTHSTRDLAEHADKHQFAKRLKMGRYVLTETIPPAPPSEPVEVDEERWTFLDEYDRSGGIRLRYRGFRPESNDERWQLVRVLSKSKYDAMVGDRAETHAIADAQDMTITNLTRDIEARDKQIATLTRERDEARERAAHLESTPPPPASGPADEGWMEAALREYDGRYSAWSKSGRESILKRFKEALRRHAPSPRYPEVCEFLDAAIATAQRCVDYQVVQYASGRWMVRWQIDDARYQSSFYDSLASACLAALSAVKERADGKEVGNEH